MEVTLLTKTEHFTDMVKNAVTATLTCHANTDKPVDCKDLLSHIIKLGHESVLEHINLTYSVKGLSRACLQELARHRHISLSVESTRHTLKRKINDEDWITSYLLSLDEKQQKILQVFLGFAWTEETLPNDELKYCLPEFWPANLIMTANIRALRHIIKLRTAPAALWEFRELAYALFDAVPEEYRYLLEDCVYKKEEKNGI